MVLILVVAGAGFFVLVAVGPQVCSSHSARLGALQVCVSTASSQSLHSTAQHHLNLHSHLVMRFSRVVS